MSDRDAEEDLDIHSDEDLRRGISKADEQRPRVEREGSEEALEANREKRAAMKEELTERQEHGR